MRHGKVVESHKLVLRSHLVASLHLARNKEIK